MHWYHWTLLACLGLFTGFSVLHLIRWIRLGLPEEYAPPAGKATSGIRYSFTGAMSPAKKESAFLHLPTYTAGLIFHVGTFTGLLLTPALAFGAPVPSPLNMLLAAILAVSAGCGIGILVKRLARPGLRALSRPDDYLSNILVTLFQAVTAGALMIPALSPAWFVLTGVMLLYLPLGKLRHFCYFFAARFHLGVLYGTRGTWPPHTPKLRSNE